MSRTGSFMPFGIHQLLLPLFMIYQKWVKSLKSGNNFTELNRIKTKLHFSRTEYIQYLVFDEFWKSEYIRYSVIGQILLFGPTLSHINLYIHDWYIIYSVQTSGLWKNFGRKFSGELGNNNSEIIVRSVYHLNFKAWS